MLKKTPLVLLALLLWSPVCMAGARTVTKGDSASVIKSEKASAENTVGTVKVTKAAKTSTEEAGAKSDTSASGGNLTILALFVVFVLACFLGVELINKVPPKLHTPLMSGSNAMSGITIVGALMMANLVKGSTISIAGFECDLAAILGTIALIFATINVVGGFLVTDRMLKMFKKGS